MTFVYLDTETTGLDSRLHQIWEVAWAVGDGPILHGRVPHSTINASPEALAINGYHSRDTEPADEERLYADLKGATIVGANPGFDIRFLSARWRGRSNPEPWHHRPLDIETYAMPLFDWERPHGLHDVWEALRRRRYMIPEPDHTAAGDVDTVRWAHRALRLSYAAPYADLGSRA